MFESVGLFAVIIGVGILLIGMGELGIKISLSGFLIVVLGFILLMHPVWETWYLFLKNVVWAIPTWVWVVVGTAVYFNLNRIYASWLDYAYHHPSSLAQKILTPQPAGLPFTPYTVFDQFMLRTLGIMFFFLTWCIMLNWLIFGGGIAKLLHLVPRKPLD